MKAQYRLSFFLSLLILTACAMWFYAGMKNSNTLPITKSLTYSVRTPSLDLPNISIKEEGSIFAKPEAENEIVNVYLSPTELYTISQWRESRGGSIEQIEIYESYDLETIMSLAEQGDVYALQQAPFTKGFSNFKNYNKLDSQMLFDAAARGSTQALEMAGISAESALRAFHKGQMSEKEVRPQFNLEGVTESLVSTMEILIASTYVTAAMRGNISESNFSLGFFQKNGIKRDFTNEEWQEILLNAKVFYQDIAERRATFGLEKFDNSYPEAYAKHGGFSKENTTLNAINDFLNSH